MVKGTILSLISLLVSITLLMSSITSQHSNLLNYISAKSVIPSKFMPVSISNSSSQGPSKIGQPSIIKNVTVSKLKRVNIPFNPLRAKYVHSPVSEKQELAVRPFDVVPFNKTVVTIKNITNSSISSPAADPPGDRNASMRVTTAPNLTSSPTHAFNVIDGLTYDEAGGFVPPDVQIGVGSKHIVELVNVAGKIWQKSGLSSNKFTLAQFFNTGKDNISDPRIIYDNSSSRWFASVLDMTNDSVKVAVSTTEDPTATWFVYSFPFSDCPDEPMIAVTKDKLAISANAVKYHCATGDPRGAQYTIVDKSDLLTGFDKPRFWRSDVNESQYAVLPVKMPDSKSGSNLLMATVGTEGGNSVTLYNITGKVPFISTGILTLPLNNTINPPVDAPQPFTGSRINVGDARLIDGVISKGKMWLAFNDGCKPKNGDQQSRSCIGLIQIDLDKNKVLQDFDFSRPYTYFYYPALNVDKAGNLNVIFGVSSDKIYPSLYITGQKVGSAPHSLNQAVNFTLGGGTILSTYYGDYFTLTQDPSHPNSFWVAGEYNPAQFFSPRIDYWATLIGNFTSSTPPMQ
jgi:hypothetical protein